MLNFKVLKSLICFPFAIILKSSFYYNKTNGSWGACLRKCKPLIVYNFSSINWSIRRLAKEIFIHSNGLLDNCQACSGCGMVYCHTHSLLWIVFPYLYRIPVQFCLHIFVYHSDIN